MTETVRLGRETRRTNCIQPNGDVCSGASPTTAIAGNQFLSRQRLRISASKAVGAVPFWQ